MMAEDQYAMDARPMSYGSVEEMDAKNLENKMIMSPIQSARNDYQYP